MFFLKHILYLRKQYRKLIKETY